jgi:DNA recombination protein RmuC
MPTSDTLFALTIAFVIGAALGVWLGGLSYRRRLAAATIRLSAAEATARGEAERRRELEADLARQVETLRELDRRLAIAEERGKVFEDARQELESRFQALAGQALQANAEQFLTLADQRLATSRSEAAADLDKRRQAIQALLQPLAESLGRLDARTGEIERARVEAYSRLDQQLKGLVDATLSLQDRTSSLTTALKGTRVSGRWGEITLRNIVELAGMTKHCDFEEQPTIEGGRRPDMVVNLPGDRGIAVDSKVSLTDYLEAVGQTDRGRRDAALDRHVKALRAHVRTLADRNYAGALGRNVDLVVLFLPGDPFLAAAFERDPDLQIEALREKVLIATPTTLIALLRTVAIYWQQSSIVENSEAIALAARELYDRAAKFGQDLARVGRGLGTALDAFNAAVGSWDRRLVPMARRLDELKVTEQNRRQVEQIESIDEQPRQPSQTTRTADD